MPGLNMDARQAKAFIDVMAASDLGEMEISHEGWTLRLVRYARGTQSPPSIEAPRLPAASRAQRVEATGPQEVRAPMFGVVHLQAAPGDPPFVKAGDVIEPGTLVCTIEAMKVFNEVRADRSGRVAAVLVASGVEVEAGQPLLAIAQVRDV
jgi:acetyl-CoA carboxylase biotin carboxyl carrier protein